MSEIWMGDADSHKKYYQLEQQALSGQTAVQFSEQDYEGKGSYLIEKVGDTAVINVKGSLTSSYAGWHKQFPSYVTSYESIVDALALATADNEVKRIVMNFATGGGSVRGVDVAGEAIRKANLIKPVTAHTDSHMFSAGYWLAANAGKITASKMAETGSIGTLMVLENYKDAAEKEGVKYHVFRAGEHKALGMPMEELTQEAKDYLQNNLDKTNKFFIDHVSTKRNLMVSERKNWADGKTFYAEEALSVGLIDKIATLSDLIPLQSTQQIDRSYNSMDAEKLAQIAGGAEPSVVLSAEELKEYEASFSVEEAKAEEPLEVKPDELNFAKQVGKLEAKLEMAMEENQRLREKQAATEEGMQALMIVAQAAITNMQNALRKPKECKNTALEVLAQFNELQQCMADTFKRGQQTTTPVQDTTRPVAGNFRSI